MLILFFFPVFHILCYCFCPAIAVDVIAVVSLTAIILCCCGNIGRSAFFSRFLKRFLKPTIEVFINFFRDILHQKGSLLLLSIELCVDIAGLLGTSRDVCNVPAVFWCFFLLSFSQTSGLFRATSSPPSSLK